MNKKIEEVLKNYNITIEKDNGYGVIKGYEVNIFYIPFNNVTPLQFAVSMYMTPAQKQEIDKSLKGLKIRFFKYEFTRYGLLFGLNGLTTNSLAKTLPSTIDRVFDCLLEKGVLQHTHCPVCGNELSEENSVKVNADGATITMHHECMSQINDEIQESDEKYEAAPNRFGMGLLGALIGGLVGSIVAFILYMLGFISAISAVVSVMLGAFLYRKFGGKPNITMMVTVLVSTLVLQLLTVFGIYLIIATGISVEDGYNYVGFSAFQYYMNDKSFASSFSKDMLFSALFTIIGLVCEVGTLRQTMRRERKINN